MRKLYRSVVWADIGARCDLNLLVDFQPMAPTELVDAYYGLLDDLRAIFDTPIDLVMQGAVKNRYVAAAIDRERQLLYAA